MPVTVLMTARPRAADHRSDAYQGDSKHTGKFFTADMNKRSNECYVFLQKNRSSYLILKRNFLYDIPTV